MTRTVSIGVALALGLAAALGGCHDNEESFYIEHMKALPDPPECKVSTGDPIIPEITVDLALAGMSDLYLWFQVTNGLMAREDYDNLKAESNGIFIDGAESVVSFGGDSAGGTDSEMSLYIEPESSSVAPAVLLSAADLQDLAAAMGCPPIAEVATGLADDLVDYGAIDGIPATLIFESGYGRVRFVGHTQGGEEVETNPFTFAITPCCNCFIDWVDASNPCAAFCQDSTEYSTCTWGVNAASLYPAHNMTIGLGDDWQLADGGVEDCTSCTD